MIKRAQDLDSTQRLLLSGLLLCGQYDSTRFTAEFMRILSIGSSSGLRAKCPAALAGLIREGLAVSNGHQLRPAATVSFQLELARSQEFIRFYQYYDDLISDKSANPGENEFRALLQCEFLLDQTLQFDETLAKAETQLYLSRNKILTQLSRELFRKGLPESSLIRKEFLPYFFPEIAMRCIYFGAAPRPWLKAGLAVFPKDSIYQLDCALLTFYAGEFSALANNFNGTNAVRLARALTYMAENKNYESASEFYQFINVLERNNQEIPGTLYATALLITGAQNAPAAKRWNKIVTEKAPAVIAKELSELLTIRNMMEVSTQYEPESEFLEPDKLHSPFTRMLALSILAKNPKTKFSVEKLQHSLQVANKLIAAGSLMTGTRMMTAISSLAPENSPVKSQAEEQSGYWKTTPSNPANIPQKPSWKSALEQLAAVSRKNASVPEAPVFFSWHISAIGKEVLKITNIAVRQHQQGSNPVSSGHQVLLSSLRSGELDHLLSAREKRIREFIKKDFDNRWIVEPAALRFLVQSPHIFLNAERVSLAVGNLTFTVGHSADGSYTLSAPENAVAAGSTFLYRKGKNLRIIEQDETLSTILRALQNCGGKMTVPPEGIADFCKVLNSLAGKVDFQGELPEELTRSVQKKELSPVPAMRITQEENGMIFEVRLSTETGSASEAVPGEGIVSVLSGGVLITRDFSEERACAERVRINCPSLTRCAQTAEWTWKSDDPENTLSVLAELQNSGIYTEFINLKRPSIVPPASTQLSFDDDDEKWLNIGGTVMVDEAHILPLAELLALYGKNNGPFVRINENKWLRLQKDLQQQLELLRNGTVLENGKISLPKAALPAVSGIFDPALFPEKLKLKTEALKQAFQQEYPVPEDFKGSLRSYQLEGYRYLRRMYACGTGCCLADDMGLGKTVQLLAFLLAESAKGPSLVIAPASVCGNWAAEAARFTPSLRVLRPGNTDRGKLISGAVSGDLVIASYGIVTSEQELFASQKWNIVILDEAQSIKNQTSLRTKAVKMLQAGIRIAATGTPVENKLSELWSLFDFITPGLLGNEQSFAGRFTENGMPLPGLRQMVSPLILRRVKKEVLRDLPEKTEITENIELSGPERELYESIRRDFKEKLCRAQGNRIEILAALTKLRRFCCHPALVFEQLPPCGTKLERVLELAENLSESGHRALIFSQFVDFLSLIRKGLDEKKLRYLYLDGSTPVKERTPLVEKFQQGEAELFLISLKAGGVGLNLTAADYVIITDPWWNPAVEDQAADRAHRIGQQRAVTVYRLVTTETVEEKVIRLHEKKRQLADDILGNAAGDSVTQQDLMEIFGD